MKAENKVSLLILLNLQDYRKLINLGFGQHYEK